MFTRVREIFMAFLVCMFAGPAGHSYALGLRTTAMTGLLQQPASQYYHLIYGGSADVQLYRSWSLRGTYLERPAFSNAGFIDQDFLGYVETGCSFFKHKYGNILGFVGAGRAWGYVKQDPIFEKDPSLSRSDYKMNVLALSMEAEFDLGYVDARLGHVMHVGQGDKTQTQSKVAWPYSAYYVSLSKLVGPTR